MQYSHLRGTKLEKFTQREREKLPVPNSKLEGIRSAVWTRSEGVDPPLPQSCNRLHSRIPCASRWSSAHIFPSFFSQFLTGFTFTSEELWEKEKEETERGKKREKSTFSFLFVLLVICTSALYYFTLICCVGKWQLTGYRNNN